MNLRVKVQNVKYQENSRDIICEQVLKDDADKALEDGDNVDEFRISVQYPPVVRMRHKQLVVDEGSNVTIVCDYQSWPVELNNIQIYHDYKEIVIDHQDSGSSVVVRLSNVSRDNAGDYSCVLGNSVGQGRPGDERTSVIVITRPRLTISFTSDSGQWIMEIGSLMVSSPKNA